MPCVYCFLTNRYNFRTSSRVTPSKSDDALWRCVYDWFQAAISPIAPSGDLKSGSTVMRLAGRLAATPWANGARLPRCLLVDRCRHLMATGRNGCRAA